MPYELGPLVNFHSPSLDNVKWTVMVRAMIGAIEAALNTRPPV